MLSNLIFFHIYTSLPAQTIMYSLTLLLLILKSCIVSNGLVSANLYLVIAASLFFLSLFLSLFFVSSIAYRLVLLQPLSFVRLVERNSGGLIMSSDGFSLVV